MSEATQQRDKGTAVIEGPYRYNLTRWWSKGPTLYFIMLNPSTATALKSDATIRRCVSFAKRDGFGSIDVRNLFALRTRNPRVLITDPDPIGPKNDMWLKRLRHVPPEHLVAAWGSNGGLRAEYVRLMVGSMCCLGITKHGHPRHPLYLKADAKIERWL